MKWTVGQEVVIQRDTCNVNQGCDADTVTKVGRAWVYVGNRKFDIVTGFGDGAQRIFPSAAAFADHAERENLWRSIRHKTAHNPPEHVPTEELRRIAAILTEKNHDPTQRRGADTGGEGDIRCRGINEQRGESGSGATSIDA